ncbi:hypothetical protein [Priestia megaterium]|uniref:hypothetical protein n=1 Tax=Priestia megaterium TaxID=1404 RepID=UPI001BE9A8CF|nr:hypothetical protein [Priestia megaterium]MBT2253835.1 hypothetical protein [Priestia megaterium]
MLQNRVNELDSGILDILGDKVYITGFTREEMLESHLTKGIENWSSKGLYDYQDLEFYHIKNRALLIVRKDEKEINRYQYKPVYRGTIQFKDNDGKVASITFTIRKSSYSDHYHFLTEKTSLLFSNRDELDVYLMEKYSIEYSY